MTFYSLFGLRVYLRTFYLVFGPRPLSSMEHLGLLSVNCSEGLIKIKQFG